MDFDKICSLVYSARKIILDKKLQSQVREKGKGDYVTAADLAASDYIKANLKEIAPNVAFVTEEEQTHESADEYFLLDPIDGTSNLVRGYNMSSVSLAYCKGGKVRFGVVYNPFSHETFFALEGHGAHLYNAQGGVSGLVKTGVENYKRGLIHVTDLPHENAVIEFGAGSTNKAFAPVVFPVAESVFNECRDLRRICSSALTVCFIAAGRIDGYFQKRIHPWDYAAASLVLTEAGGKITQWDGKAMTLNAPSSIVAGNVKVHAYLCEKLKDL